MRLSRPVYESLPLVYMVTGCIGISVFYLDPPGFSGKLAFLIGVCLEIAALTLFLRRMDYRDLSREYSRDIEEFRIRPYR
jgi:hypothetical protein